MDPRYEGYEEHQALPVPRAVKTRPDKAVAPVRLPHGGIGAECLVQSWPIRSYNVDDTYY